MTHLPSCHRDAGITDAHHCPASVLIVGVKSVLVQIALASFNVFYLLSQL